MQIRQNQSIFYKSLLFGLKLIFIVCFVFNLNLSVLASNQGITVTELVIQPPDISTVPFSINPGNIFVGENLTFTLGPAVTTTNVILNNAPCEIWIKPVNATNYIVLSGRTNSSGFCTYRTNQTLSQQNLILLTQPLTPDFPRPTNVGTQAQSSTPSARSFDFASAIIKQAVGGNTSLSAVNQVPGNGASAFGLVVYQGEGVLSNNILYNVGGGVASINTDYPGDSGVIIGENGSSSTKSNNSKSNSIPSSSIFNFLPRTGGFTASIGFFLFLVIIVVYLLSRRNSRESSDNKKDAHNIKKKLPKN